MQMTVQIQSSSSATATPSGGIWSVTLTAPADITPGTYTFFATAVVDGVESGNSNSIEFTISCAPTVDAHADVTDLYNRHYYYWYRT